LGTGFFGETSKTAIIVGFKAFLNWTCPLWGIAWIFPKGDRSSKKIASNQVAQRVSCFPQKSPSLMGKFFKNVDISKTFC